MDGPFFAQFTPVFVGRSSGPPAARGTPSQRRCVILRDFPNCCEGESTPVRWSGGSKGTAGRHHRSHLGQMLHAAEKGKVTGAMLRRLRISLTTHLVRESTTTTWNNSMIGVCLWCLQASLAWLSSQCPSTRMVGLTPSVTTELSCLRALLLAFITSLCTPTTAECFRDSHRFLDSTA